jgi:hypothetical protein
MNSKLRTIYSIHCFLYPSFPSFLLPSFSLSSTLSFTFHNHEKQETKSRFCEALVLSSLGPSGTLLACIWELPVSNLGRVQTSLNKASRAFPRSHYANAGISALNQATTVSLHIFSNSLFSLFFLLLRLWSIGHPWNALFHFSFLILREPVGLLGWGMGPSNGRCLHKRRINAHMHPCLECDSNPRSPVLERAKAVHALDHAAIVIANSLLTVMKTFYATQPELLKAPLNKQ